MRVRAWTTSGTASLRIAPKGTADGSQWEQTHGRGTTAVAVHRHRGPGSGTPGAMRIRNASTRAVPLVDDGLGRRHRLRTTCP